MLNSWASQNRIITQDWKGLSIVVSEAGTQYSGKHGGKIKVELYNNRIGLEVLIVPKISF